MRTYTVIVVNPLEQCDKDDKPAGMLFQYDYGQRIVFGGVDLPQAYEVHFSNQKMGKSVTVIGDATGIVDIPDAMLLTGQDVHVWLYLHQGEDDGETVYYARIAVKGRAKPTHETPTPVQQDEITQAIAALNAAVEATEADASAAEASAEDAGRAQAAAEAAQDRAEAAQGAAESAQTGAETAQDKAEDAQEAAEGARDRAEAAAAFLEGCSAEAETLTAGSAATASYSEGVFHFGIPRGSKGSKGDPGDRGPEGPTGPEGPEGPAGYSPTASVSKSGSTATISITDKTGTTTASVTDGAPGQDGYTPQRGTDYWTAADKAEIVAEAESEFSEDISDIVAELSEQKSDIDRKAPVIYQDASGDIISFTDGADGMPLKECTVAVDPVQDLHGQSNPYPAGGGANKMPPPVNISFPSGLTVTNKDGLLTISGTASSGMIAAVDVGSFTFAESGQKILLFNSFTGGTIYFYNMDTQVDYFSLSSTNRVVAESSMSALKGKTITKYRILISSETTFSNATIGVVVCGTSENPSVFAPYSNICPITGHTKTTVTRTGKNLFSYDNLFDGYWMTTGFVGTGEPISYSGYGWCFVRIPVEAGDTITVSGCQQMGGTKSAFYHDTPNNVVSDFLNTSQNGTMVVPEGANYLGLCILRGSDYDPKTNYSNAQVEIASSASTFVPYQGQTYPISWQTAAGTIYGGTVDNATGKLYNDAEMLGYNNNNWALQSINSHGIANFQYYVFGEHYTDIKSNMFPRQTTGISDTTTEGVSVSGNESTIYVRIESIKASTVADFKAWAVANGLQVLVRKRSGVVTDITPVQITTLRESNIWADTGAVAVTYPADTQTYVDSAITAATDPDGNVVTVSGSTPSITGESGKRYVCGTVDSISITPPGTGIIDVVFTSGTTPAVLTVPSSVMFPAWFDPTSLEASAKYEINIMDGSDGVVSKWT